MGAAIFMAYFPNQVFKLTESIIFGVLLLAQSLAVFAPNFSRARHGAAFVLGLRNSLPKLYAVGRKFVDENKVDHKFAK